MEILNREFGTKQINALDKTAAYLSSLEHILFFAILDSAHYWVMKVSTLLGDESLN